MTTPVQQARLRVTGHYAGPVSRAAAAALDVAIIFATYTAGYAGLNLLTNAFLGVSISGDKSGPLAGLALLTWAFLYTFGSLAVTGRTPGKALVGLRVVRANGATLPVKRALLRTLALPLSVLILGIGLLLIIVQREHRALHDLIAGTAVVYDWGDRPAEIPGPLSEFLTRAEVAPDLPTRR
jgi:uncharacterized RDD family membrane protein YckC